MAIEYFEKEVGSSTAISKDDPKMVLVGDPTIGDWIRLPSELGGTDLMVVDCQARPCVCEKEHLAMCYVLEQGYDVYECSDGSYLWVEKK